MCKNVQSGKWKVEKGRKFYYYPESAPHLMSERIRVRALHLNHPSPTGNSLANICTNNNEPTGGWVDGSGRTNGWWIALGEQMFRIQMCPWTHAARPC